jgi:hypothetical protein
MKPFLFLFPVIFLALLLPPQDMNPGKERWTVKTSVTHFKPAVEIPLRQLLTLPDPIKKFSGKSREKYQEQLIPSTVGASKLKEGDIVTVYGYIMLAALECDDNGQDGDYHIQIRPVGYWSDSCLVVEVPFPPFIKGNKMLKDSVQAARDFFDDKILKGKKHACFGTKNKPAPFVRITGQLFFDAHHINTEPRGKQNSDTKQKMKSYTCWEIHPVFSVSTARKNGKRILGFQPEK